ncbi:MAG TPA: hypothetical protein PLV34_07490 [Bacillota bacterium]|nr:hypothetical protein [Bacillota bacterium]
MATTLRKLIAEALARGYDFDQTARRVEVTFPQAKVKKIRAIYEELRAGEGITWQKDG